MSRLSGKAGEVKTPNSVTGIKSWKLDYTVDPLDVTGFDNAGVSAFIGGITKWSGSFEGYKDGAPQALTTGALVSAEFLESQTATQKYTGSILITGVHPAVSHDGPALMSYDFQGSGALTVATA